MKINFNKKNIINALSIGTALVLITVGGVSLKKEDNNKKIISSAITEVSNDSINDSDIVVPQGYTLENRDGKFYAVREVVLTVPAEKLTSDNGDIYYSLEMYPGYTLVETEAGYIGCKIVEEVIPLHIENNKSK